MMQDLTPDGQKIVDDVAQRHGVSRDAVLTLLQALRLGHGAQAQFSHPDLGGMGQWSQGGMTMVGDMFNQGLKYRVDSLCSELAGLLRGQPFFRAPASSQSQSQSGGSAGVSLFVPQAGPWWPADLGYAGSTGAQNDLLYAYFPDSRRLAIRQGGRVSVYDTGEHRIGGFSQQQGGDQSITFTSQYGLVRVADLPLLTAGVEASVPVAAEPAAWSMQPEPPAAAGPVWAAPPVSAPFVAAPLPAATQMSTPAAPDDIFAKLERLADLHQKGILTEEEFKAKKAEFLSRL